MLTEGMLDQELIAYLTAKIERLKEELDTERMRLAACGVIASANTPDSAKQARQMKGEYWSASCADVANAVDREMALREQLAECQASEKNLTAKLEKSKQYHRMMELEKENFRMNQQLVECQAREAKLREAVEYTIAEAKLTDFQYEVCRQAVNEPHDDTALREYAEDYLNNSPEVALLNKIGKLLEDVDYKGDYADGIKALVKQERKQGILDAAEFASTQGDIDFVVWQLHKMAEE